MSAAAGLAEFKEREFIAVIGDEASPILPASRLTDPGALTWTRIPSQAFSSQA